MFMVQSCPVCPENAALLMKHPLPASWGRWPEVLRRSNFFTDLSIGPWPPWQFLDHLFCWGKSDQVLGFWSGFDLEVGQDRRGEIRSWLALLPPRSFPLIPLPALFLPWTAPSATLVVLVGSPGVAVMHTEPPAVYIGSSIVHDGSATFAALHQVSWQQNVKICHCNTPIELDCLSYKNTYIRLQKWFMNFWIMVVIFKKFSWYHRLVVHNRKHLTKANSVFV